VLESRVRQLPREGHQAGRSLGYYAIELRRPEAGWLEEDEAITNLVSATRSAYDGVVAHLAGGASATVAQTFCRTKGGERGGG
jgi:hypothetical protein